MKNALSALGALAVLSLLGCGGKPAEPKPLPAPPAIKTFAADKTRITAGESVTLSFEAENATEVELVDQAGERLATTGTPSSGTAVVTPAKSAFFVLRAKGEGGRDSAFVQVAVDEDLRDVFVAVVPETVDSGETAQLLWSAPHARSAVLRVSDGTQVALDPANGSGIEEVHPARTMSYELVASGLDPAQELRSATELKVRPVLVAFTATPAAARPGETMTLTWKTRGATEVVLSESSFGDLKQVSTPEVQDLDEGTLEWTVPATLPSGAQVLEGHPLRFTLAVRQTNPDVQLFRTLEGYVGEGPKIVSFDVPDKATEQSTFELAWHTLNVERLQVLADGGVIYEPLPGNNMVLSVGSLRLAAPAKETRYELRVWGHGGVIATASKVLRLVAPPRIDSFTAPTGVAQPGSPANVSWTTTGASSVLVGVKNGPSVLAVTDPAAVASGSAALYPGARTTFVLAAYNEAGAEVTAEKTIDVAAPGIVAATPSPVTPGEQVTVSWSVDPLATAELIGDPTFPPVKNNPGTVFIDLDGHSEAKEVSFDNVNDGVARIALPVPFSFPFVGQPMRSFYVSTNGFLSATNLGALPANADLTAASTPSVVAPYWDDLDLGETGKVLYWIDGATFPRALVVQWNKVKLASDANTELTFQVQLLESGEVRFEYKTLQGVTAQGQSANVGWRSSAGISSTLSSGSNAVLTEGDEFIYFASGGVTGAFTVTATQTSAFTLFARLQTGAWVVYPAPLTVIPPGSVVLTEAMVQSPSTAPLGRWAELYNSTSEDIVLDGAVLSTSAGATSYTFPEGTVLKSREYLVIGESLDPMENGEANVTKLWGALAPDATANDAITVSAVQPISSLGWSANPPPDMSVQLAERAIDSTGAKLPCNRVKTYGQVGVIGTPGARNETCFEYAVESIALAYRDISMGGTALFPMGASNQDSVKATVSLGNKPFTFFGRQYSSMTVSSNGLLGFLPFGHSYTGNDTKPDTDPAGVIAPFWDDLDSDWSGLGNVFVDRVSPGEDPAAPMGHSIVQWHHYSYWSVPAPGDDLNFQVKLFDDGIIEFHYAKMTSGSSANFGNGNSATVWISRPSGDAALQLSINQPLVVPNSAWRFVPNN